MHPEIARELTSERGRDMRDQAHQAMLARTAARVRRARRHGVSKTDELFVVPTIPDYVDGTFRVTPADGTPANGTGADRSGRMPTPGRAA
jgi:hypothetical protein